jgi:RNA polymerase sigma-70 factor (ECF subfamily)
MAEPDSFADVMARLRAGDQGAAAAVFERFTRRLVGLARTHLDTWVRRKEDPEDVVQSVYKSFFARHGEGQFDLASWNDFWSLLALITLRKCANRVEHLRAGRRDAAREVALPERDERSGGDWAGIDREPRPEEAAALAETVRELLAGLDANERAIVELSLQGATTEEVSGQLGFSQRTVRRVRERLKKRLERMQSS